MKNIPTVFLRLAKRSAKLRSRLVLKEVRKFFTQNPAGSLSTECVARRVGLSEVQAQRSLRNLANRGLIRTEFQARIVHTAIVHGWRVMHQRPARTKQGWRTTITGHRGFPDLVFAKEGRILIAEVKTDTGRLRLGQREWLHQLGNHGRLWRPRDWEDILAELSE